MRNMPLLKLFRLESSLAILLFGLECSLFVTTSVKAKDIGGYSTTFQEHLTCKDIIPRFVEQVMSHKSSECDASGAFPQPGNCTTFFKCIRGKTKIQPFLEYCAVGYVFVDRVCIPNSNASDCPQYTCRIPDDGHGSGNEIDLSDNDVTTSQSAYNPPVDVTQPTPEGNDLLPTDRVEFDASSQQEDHIHETKHSDQTLVMAQTNRRSGSGASHVHIFENMAFFLCLIVLFSRWYTM